jgi:hypothetical protein
MTGLYVAEREAARRRSHRVVELVVGSKPVGYIFGMGYNNSLYYIGL